MNEAQTENSRVDVSTSKVTPAKPRDDSRDNEAHNKDERQIIPMLPPYNGALREVANISNTGSATWLEQHPSYMGVEEAFVGVVGIKVGVGVTVVRTMTTGPPFNGALDGASTEHGQDVL